MFTQVNSYGRWDSGTLLTDDGVVLDLTGVIDSDFTAGNAEARLIRDYLLTKKNQLAISSIKLIPLLDVQMEITFDTGKVEKMDVKALILQAAFQIHAKNGSPEYIEISLDNSWGFNILPTIATLVKL